MKYLELEEKYLEYDYLAAEEIRNEMEELMKSIIVNNTDNSKKDICFEIQKASLEITDSLIEITSDEYKYSTYPIQIIPPICELSSHKAISIHEGFVGGARSTKFGNIKLNLDKLCVLSYESVFPIVAATHTPWLIPFAALMIFNKLWSLQNIQITEREAIVIWVMWNKRDQKDCSIKTEEVLDLVNTELSSYARPQMTPQEFEIVIRNLEKMRCIEESKENKWHLLEEVQINY